MAVRHDRRIATATYAGNVLLLLILIGLGALAFSIARRRRELRARLWRLRTSASAAQIDLRGAFAVWLSFWITAHFSTCTS